MNGWVEVAKTAEIPPGQCKPVIIGDRMLAIINLAGEFHAIDNICTHAYVELCGGMILGDRIQCPLHGAQFNIRTGAVESPPAYEPLKTYPVRVEGEGILVQVED